MEVVPVLVADVQAVDSVVLVAAALAVVAPEEVGSFLGALTGFSFQSLARIQLRINSLLRKINLRLDPI